METIRNNISQGTLLTGKARTMPQGQSTAVYAILTISDIDNYGNRLQNYALQEMLKAYGPVTTIHCETKVDSQFGAFKARYRRQKAELKSYAKNVLGGDKKLNAQRWLKNLRFTNHLVPDRSISINSVDGLQIHNKNVTIKKIVIGSDQVWNYRWLTENDLRMRLGMFAPSEKIITYAASIGVSDIPENLQPIFQKGLQRIPAISVREDRAKELVKQVSDQDAIVVLDPTLMLTADKWRSICHGFVPDDDRYVLTYFLGKPSQEQEAVIQHYAQQKGIRTRRILDTRDPETFVAGPEDFVELFSKADFIFTDSYHACCFSIIFNKQFKVFDRAGHDGIANMNSRIETLFRQFHLENTMSNAELIRPIDYEEVNKLLHDYQLESQEWLTHALI